MVATCTTYQSRILATFQGTCKIGQEIALSTLEGYNVINWPWPFSFILHTVHVKVGGSKREQVDFLDTKFMATTFLFGMRGSCSLRSEGVI
jgi:hypothetical protein